MALSCADMVKVPELPEKNPHKEKSLKYVWYQEWCLYLL